MWIRFLSGAGHFNVLRGHLPGRGDGDRAGRGDGEPPGRPAAGGVSGIKVVGDFVQELGQIVTGQRPGRQGPAERILLWHRGLAILDIAVGQLILAKAEQAGIGTMLRYR